jgi:hypothetical protein
MRRQVARYFSLACLLPSLLFWRALAFGASSSRRDYVQSSALAIIPALVPAPESSRALADDDDGSTDEEGGPLIIPIKYAPALSAYVVSYTVGGSKFEAIIDTGSPFLLVPSYCDENKYGCYRSEQSEPSGLAPTYERFNSNEGMVEWRRGSFSFRQDGLGGSIGVEKNLFPNSMIFGILSESLMDGPGGIFLGLVKNTDARIRPSFLGQSNVKAFSIDLRAESEPKTLTLCKRNDALINEDWIRLNGVKDLQKAGDPTRHYSAQALEVSVNGTPLVALDAKAKNEKKKKTIVIFDTGVSGMIICPDLFETRYQIARTNREKSLWGQVDVSFRTERGKTLTLSAIKPLTTPFGSDRPWKKRFDAHLIVMGLAFLDNKKTTIDIDNERLWIEA